MVAVREEDEVPADYRQIADLRYSAPLYRLAGEDAVVAAVLGERQPDLLTLPAPSYRLFSQVWHTTVMCGLLLCCMQVHQSLKEYDSEAGQVEMVVRAEGGEEGGCWLVSTVDLEPGQQIQVQVTV